MRLFPSLSHRWIRELAKPYILPDDHPIREKLDTLLHAPDLFKDRESLERAGFEWLVPVPGPRRLRVVSHPEIAGYVLKTHSSEFTEDPYPAALFRAFRRVKRAREARSLIEAEGFNHIAVSKKWLYHTPRPVFINGKEWDFYLVVAERLDLVPIVSKAQLASYYHQLGKEEIRELCLFLSCVGGADAVPANVPLTTDGRIAFIDTDHLGFVPDAFERLVIPALAPEMQSYASELVRTSPQRKRRRFF